MGRIEYRVLADWPFHRVGSDRSIWFDETPPGRPPPWDRPRWRRLTPRPSPAGPTVRLRHAGGASYRAVALLHRAAFDPAGLPPAVRARLGPRPAAAAIAAARPPLPADLPPPYVAPPALPLDRPGTAPPAVAPVEPMAIVVLEDDDDDDDRGPVRGSAHGRARLAEDQVLEARRLHAAGWTERALARRYGVSFSGMHYAIVGQTWTHLPRE